MPSEPATSGDSTQEKRFLPVGMSLGLIIVIFFTIVSSLLLLNNARIGILSGVRAYVNGEALYSKAQKDAVNHLVNYASNHSVAEYRKFIDAMAVPGGDARARSELLKPQPDMAEVRAGFLAGRNHPEDIDNMAGLFRDFRDVSFMAKAIDIWTKGDAKIEKLLHLGEEIDGVVQNPPLDREHLNGLLEQVHATNAELTILEDDFSRTLGEGNRWLEWRLLILMYAATGLIVIAGTLLTWRILGQVRVANQALRTQRDQWQVTLASIGDAVLVCDREGKIVSLNVAAETLCGWQESEALGKDLNEVFQIFDERTNQPIDHPVDRSVEDGKVTRLEGHIVLRAKDGSYRSIEDTVAPINGRNGKIVGSVVVSRDVSARRRAEEVMRRSEERYRSLVAVTASIIWTTDAKGAFVAPQPSWETYTGRRSQMNADDGWLSAIDPADRVIVGTAWKRALVERSVLHTEGKIWHAASQSYRHFSAHAVPLLHADGSVREWIGTLTDVDDRKRAEEALQEANRHKDDFLAMLAHELRNPLSPIRNSVHALEQLAPQDPRIQRAAGMIHRQVIHMTRLIDDLLDVSRVARGKIVLKHDKVDLTRLVQTTADDYRPTFEESQVGLEVDIPDHELWLEGDPTRLSQAIGNLLHNATKFTPAGGTVRLELTTTANGRRALVTVSDNGIGIEARTIEHVFDTFTQADNSLDRSRGGLGLGLALVKGLVELHGGTAKVASGGLGQGSQFTIELPLADAPQPTRIQSRRQVADHRSRRILVIEDNLDVAESMKFLLEVDGHQVALADTAIAGIDAAERFRPQVILCDIGLPGGMDGFAVARILRSNPALRFVYLIALTGYGQEEYRKRAREAGFDLHLTKPVDPSVLDDVLGNLPNYAA